MSQKRLVKGLKVFLLIFSLLFYQSWAWAPLSFASEATQSSRQERPERPSHERTQQLERSERPEKPDRPDRPDRPDPPERLNQERPSHEPPSSPIQAENQRPSLPSPTTPPPSPTSPPPPQEPTPKINNNLLKTANQGQAAGNQTPTPTLPPDNTSQDSTNNCLNDPLNQNTGPFSENIASYENQEKTTISNLNYAWIENELDSFANTGWNQANYNTGHGTITTGQAYTWVSVQTTANTNSASVPDFLQEEAGSPMAVQNEATGAESFNLAESEILNEVEVINENNLETNNEIGAISNTGNNQTMFNTGHGMITSGDAQAAVDLVINANSNFLNSDQSLMGSFSLFGENVGDLDFSQFGQTSLFESNDNTTSDGFVEENLSYFETDASVLASNTTTGPYSENYALLEATSSAKTINNNQAVVENNVLVAATTGGNTSSYNTGHGIVESGNADLLANVVNFINSNVVDSEVILATINVFGEWVGNLILPSLGLEENSSQEAVIVTLNENTGPNSHNEVETTLNSEFEVVNNNDGVIINDLKPEANTGNNQAEHNTGAGRVETGAVSAQSSLVSIANTNITNSNPILLIINILGEWVGEIVSLQGAIPHQAGEQDVLIYSTFGGETLNFASGPATLAEIFNENTGPNSENIAETNIEKNVLIENSNDFVVGNNINLLADTGGNEASYNTGQGIIKTGDANLAANLVNFVNTNLTGAKPIIVVINVFGQWLGNILAAQPSADDSNNQGSNQDESGFDSGPDLPNSPANPSEEQSNSLPHNDSFLGNTENNNSSASSNNQNGSSQEDNSQNKAPSPVISPPPSSGFPLLGFLTDDSGSGSDFSGGSFLDKMEADSSRENSSSVLGAKLFFDPYGLSTSLGTFLVASPQVLKMIGSKGMGFPNGLVSFSSLLPLLLVFFAGMVRFIKKPLLD